tara:strand:+ start:335 stop:436 length:102 start_codon:yes stop_codon:yes gene_type:complete
MIEEHAEKEVIAAKRLRHFCLTVPDPSARQKFL